MRFLILIVALWGTPVMADSCIYGCGGGPYPQCEDIQICDASGCRIVHMCR